jgi:hypothetical protein
MTASKYISIKSVLYQLSLLIDERYWNETIMLELATKAARSMQLSSMLEEKVSLVELKDHKAQLPDCIRYLVQVALIQDHGCLTSIADSQDLPENSSWCISSASGKHSLVPMRLASSPFHLKLAATYSNCNNCKYEFSVSPSLVLTSNVNCGKLLVSYLAFPTDEEGNALIPDDEDVKTAIMHYVLYMYWLSKMSMKEQGAERLVEFHLRQYQIASLKSKNLMLPDTNEMENIKNIRNRLVPRTNQFDSFFTKLNNQENVDF